MLRSVPVPFQTILWPLLGAALILALGRLLPGSLRRLLAVAAVGASLVALWSLRGAGAERVEMVWQPLNFFRASPALSLAGLAWPGALLLTILTLALALGFPDREDQVSWHGLLLLLLAGALAVVMGANLLTLALGSALMDLALIGLALWTGEPGRAAPLSGVVPGVAATLLLAMCALRLDAEAGYTSFLTRQIPAQITTLMVGASVLRAMVFPLHPRRLAGAAAAGAILLPTATGLYLLARVQTLAATDAVTWWPAVLGSVALLAGGLLAATSGDGDPEKPGAVLDRVWGGLLVHQVGAGILFVLLVPTLAPTPVLALSLSLGLLAICWDTSPEAEGGARPRWLDELWQRSEDWRLRLEDRLSLGERRPAWWLLLPGLALVSLAGLPFTLGARGRWPLYASLLREGGPALWPLLLADSLLVTGLWLALRGSRRQLAGRRWNPLSLLAALLLAGLLLILGLFPGDALGWPTTRQSGVSVWGLGLLYLLPWLLGTWLASLAGRWQKAAGPVHRAVQLDWFFGLLTRVGRWLEGAGHWLSQVGEGEGWWGWALIILALAAIFLAGR